MLSYQCNKCKPFYSRVTSVRIFMVILCPGIAVLTWLRFNFWKGTFWLGWVHLDLGTFCHRSIWDDECKSHKMRQLINELPRSCRACITGSQTHQPQDRSSILRAQVLQHNGRCTYLFSFIDEKNLRVPFLIEWKHTDRIFECLASAFSFQNEVYYCMHS